MLVRHTICWPTTEDDGTSLSLIGVRGSVVVVVVVVVAIAAERRVVVVGLREAVGVGASG